MEEATDEGRDGICDSRAVHPVKQRSSFAVELTNIITWCSICGARTDVPNSDCKNCKMMVELKEGNDA